MSQKPDLHIYAGTGPTQDHQAAAESCEIDAALDREWFAANPTAKKRVRPCSLRELRAFGCALGSKVLVVRGKHGEQYRYILGPDEQLN